MTFPIHDSGYKRLFSNHTIIRQLLETFVKEPWVAELDFTNCETVDKSFIDEEYKRTESDLIYKFKLCEQEVYIYIIIEFQSEVQRFMVVRVIHYISAFYLDYINDHKQRDIKKLPVIFPIVLYNGSDKWTAPDNLADLVENTPSLGGYGISCRYFKIAENEYEREVLLRIANIVSTLFLAEAHYDLAALISELVSLFEREEDKVAVWLFINFLRQLALYGNIKQEDYTELEKVYRSSEEVKSMLVKTLETQRSKFRQEGVEEGRQEGEQIRALRIARNMLAQNFAPSQIADLTKLSIAEVQKVQFLRTLLAQEVDLPEITVQTQLALELVKQIALDETTSTQGSTENH